jgi:isopenicillin-N N-acyltransferase-like protein
MGTFPLPVIAVSGTPAECGAAYGAAAADLIIGNNEAYLRRYGVRAGLSPALVRAAGARFRETTLEYHPRIAAMLDGVAEGAGVPTEEIYALNARTELLYGTAATECTGVAVLPEHTATGQTLLAQNWDWHPTQRAYTVLLATRDEHGFAVVTLAEAGMLAKAGVNSAGLGVCVNMLGCDRDGRPGGVPYHVLLRAALEAPALGSAIEAVCSLPRSASINLLVGQAFGEGGPGEIIDLEAVPGDVGFLNPVEGLITHANHFESLTGIHDTLKDLGGSSFFRGPRARRLLGAGSVAEKDLAAVLADHGGHPRAICRHDAAPVTRDEDRSETIYSVIIDLDERRLALAEGPPCRAAGYVDVRIGEVFA